MEDHIISHKFNKLEKKIKDMEEEIKKLKEQPPPSKFDPNQKLGEGYCQTHGVTYKILNSPMGGCPYCNHERGKVDVF